MNPEAGRLVAKLREQRGLTQKDLADAVGVDPATISRGERGGGRWYARTARRIFDTLNSAAPLQASESQALLHALDLTATLSRPARSTSAEPARYSILPADIEAVVSQLIYVAGPGAVIDFLRAAQALMSASDEVLPVPHPTHQPHPTHAVAGGDRGGPPRIPGAVSIESTDPETGMPVRTYIPASPKPADKPAAARRAKGR